MAMSKQDFELIARAIKEEADKTEGDNAAKSYHYQVFKVAQNICNALADSHPRFDYARFMTACGFPFTNGGSNE